jgi:hypothetical protein
MIHSEMTGILDRPQRRIEATWDAGELIYFTVRHG